MRLVLRNGAITQPLRMEYRQTQINAVESLGMTSAKLGPSIVRAKEGLDRAINDRYIAKAISTPFYSG
jgi:hypothetical protein